MIKFKNILNKFKKVSKAKKVIALVAVLAIFSSTTLAVWGPSRPSFDYNDPTGRLGSMTGPVFNSMKNTPTYGDEFNFTTAKKTTDSTWSNDLAVKNGDEVEIRVYIHNNANTGTNASGLGIATGVKSGIDLPQNQYGTKNEPIGFVRADNSTPKNVWDGTMISSADGKKFKLDYIEGSATLTQRDGSGTATAKLNDSFIGTAGTAVGSQPGSATDGKWLGCYEHVGWVVVKVKVVGEKEEKPSYSIKKFVNNQDANTNPESVQVKANEEFDYRIDVTNDSQVELKNVKVWDVLPAGVKYSDGTLKLDGSGVANDEDFFNPNKGVVIPSIPKGAKATFTMKASIPGTATEISERLCKPGVYYNNVAIANPEGEDKDLPQKEDNAIVRCAEQPAIIPSTGPSALLTVVITLIAAGGALVASYKLSAGKQ